MTVTHRDSVPERKPERLLAWSRIWSFYSGPPGLFGQGIALEEERLLNTCVKHKSKWGTGGFWQIRSYLQQKMWAAWRVRRELGWLRGFLVDKIMTFQKEESTAQTCLRVIVSCWDDLSSRCFLCFHACSSGVFCPFSCDMNSVFKEGFSQVSRCLCIFLLLCL